MMVNDGRSSWAKDFVSSMPSRFCTEILHLKKSCCSFGPKRSLESWWRVHGRGAAWNILKLAWDWWDWWHLISTIGSGKGTSIHKEGTFKKKHENINTTSAIDPSRFLRWSDAQQTYAAEQKDLRHSSTTLCDEENHDLLTAISSRWLASRSTVNKPLESTR